MRRTLTALTVALMLTAPAAAMSEREAVELLNAGITALQALTAAHAIPLNTIGAPVTITTGRRLRDEGFPQGVDRIAVFLDGECSFRSLDPSGLTIWWGAYVGMPEQIVLSGPVADLADRIVATRAEARARHGWIMDVYILDRAAPGQT